MAGKKDVYKDVVVEGVIESLRAGDITPSKINLEFKRAIDQNLSQFVTNDDLKDKAIKAFIESIKVPRTIEVKRGKNVKKMEGLVHSQTEDLLKIIIAGLPVMIVGIAGVGKTTAAEQVADALDLSFHAISVGMQTTKTDILGFIDAAGKYQQTGFRKAFEKGGVYLMDEVDAGNPNVLITINSAISNGFVEFPDKMVRKHKDFKFVSTANTYGNGNDSKFVGRNKLDAATLDRFVVLNWEIDEILEDAIVSNKDWLAKVRNLRKEAAKKVLDIMITPRISIFGSQLLEAGFSESKVKDMVLYKGADEDTKAFIVKHFINNKDQFDGSIE